MDTLLQDLRFAFRSLAKSPGFTAVAVLTLALGIGPTTAIFTLAYNVLLKPLPYPDSQQLVGLSETYAGAPGELDVTYSGFQFFVDHNPAFAHVAASTEVGFNVNSGNLAERVDGLHVSRDFFTTLGVHPALGRDFAADEDAPGGPSVVVLSHGYWARRFGGDSGIVGRTIGLDGTPATVIGVLPASFRWLGPVDVFTTLAQVGRTIGSGQNLHLLARLSPGITMREMAARAAPVLASFRAQFKPRLRAEVREGFLPLQQLDVQPVQTPVRVLFGAITLVLLIACANVANLLLGRASARGRELAVRVAIGATRRRLVRQALTESVVLALAGGAAGLLLAGWGLGALLALTPENLLPVSEVHLDGWVMAFTLGTSLMVGIGFGLAPAWQAAAADVHEGLKESGGRTTGGAAGGRLRGALVVSEVAISLVLLVGAGLLLRTVANLVRTDPGFDRRDVIAAEIWLTGPRYDSTAGIAGFYDELRRRLEAGPGVRSAAVIEAGIPLLRGGNMGVMVNGAFLQTTINYRTVTPRYFETLGIPLVRGRTFTAADGGSAEPVAVVSESFARRFLDGDGLGRSVALGGGSSRLMRVVGVVGDTRQFIGAPPLPTVFLPSAQTSAGLTHAFNSWFPINVVVRTAGDADAMTSFVARTIRATDAGVPLGRVRTMDQILATSLAIERFELSLLLAFAVLAAALAAVGLYGVMSYLVAQSTREIGVRMALGARPRQVLGIVVGRGMRMAGLGAVLGIAGALALTRLLGHELYQVPATDPGTFAAVTGLLLLVALVATLVPARRATQVDPMVALRSE